MDKLTSKLNPRDEGELVMAILEIRKALKEGDVDNLDVVLEGVDGGLARDAKKNLVEMVVRNDDIGKAFLLTQLLKADTNQLNEEETRLQAVGNKLLKRLVEDNKELKGARRKLNYLILNLVLHGYADVFCSRLHSKEASKGAEMAEQALNLSEELIEK